ncbi:hypothetical protein C8F01DRAFT_1141408 [Mycena amicta]|nr:hypothetical protein C8F01DRAFT_1141408 [Mycena amicta]
MATSALVFANLVEALLEAGFFGVYAVLFVTVLYLFRSRERRPSNIVVWGLVSQFVVIAGHWINGLYQILYALGRLDEAGADTYYNNPSSTAFSVALGLSEATGWITNLLVIHRVYVIFSHRFILVVPSLVVLFLGQVVSGSGLLYFVVKSHHGEQFLELYNLSNPWVTTMLVASILISVYSTVMISWRILRVNPSSQRIGGGVPLTTALANIAESAALQTAITIGVLVTYRMGYIGQIVFNGILPVILGISTVLIYARIGLGWAHGASNIATSLPTRINFALPQEDALELDENLDGRK